MFYILIIYNCLQAGFSCVELLLQILQQMRRGDFYENRVLCNWICPQFTRISPKPDQRDPVINSDRSQISAIALEDDVSCKKERYLTICDHVTETFFLWKCLFLTPSPTRLHARSSPTTSKVSAFAYVRLGFKEHMKESVWEHDCSLVCAKEKKKEI